MYGLLSAIPPMPPRPAKCRGARSGRPHSATKFVAEGRCGEGRLPIVYVGAGDFFRGMVAFWGAGGGNFAGMDDGRLFFPAQHSLFSPELLIFVKGFNL